MKTNKKTIISILGAVVLGLLLGALFFGGPKTKTNDSHQHESAQNEEGVWTCSMHPGVRQNEPGDCPICGMELIPVLNESNADMDPMSISMSETAMKLADIRTATVTMVKPVRSIQLNGTVQTDERRIFTQSVHFSGRIEDLRINYTGEYVKKGQVLATLYSPELISAQRELFEAIKVQDTQPQFYTSAVDKLRNLKLAQWQIDQIIQTGTIKDVFPVLAERSGYISKKMVTAGDYVNKGKILYEISDLSTLWVLFDVYESDMSWIKTGDMVNFLIKSFPGETFSSTISYLDPVVNATTRVAKARVEIDNPDNKIKPGMFASATVEAKLSSGKSMIAVAKTAVMWTGKRSLVYVRSASTNGIAFTMREVVLGADLGDKYVIKSGLKMGEVIAVNGTFSIDAAAQLAGKPSMMNPEGAAFKSAHDHGDMDMSTDESTHEDHEIAKDHDMITVKSYEISAEAREALAPVYDTYLDFKDALVSDDVKLAKRKVLALKNELESIDMSLFTGDAHHAFMAEQEKILMHIPDKKKLSDIERIRTAFEFISDGMIGLTKAFLPLDETVYVQYCPMAFNNKGADWISRDKDIKNPYFGASMLTCGEVTDSLNPRINNQETRTK